MFHFSARKKLSNELSKLRHDLITQSISRKGDLMKLELEVLVTFVKKCSSSRRLPVSQKAVNASSPWNQEKMCIRSNKSLLTTFVSALRRA